MPLPTELTEALTRLTAEAPIDRAELKKQVEGHIAKAETEFADRVFFDASFARQLGQGCLALLEIDGLSAVQQGLVQAACRYFVEDEDEDGDFSSMTGFEDDAILFNHVSQALGRDDLVMTIE